MPFYNSSNPYTVSLGVYSSNCTDEIECAGTQHATPDTSAFREMQPDALWLAGTLGPDEAAQLRESTRDWGTATLSAVLATKTSLVHAVFGRSDPGFVEQFKGRVCSGVMFLRRPSRADKTHDVQLIVADWGGHSLYVHQPKGMNKSTNVYRPSIYQPDLRRPVNVYYAETMHYKDITNEAACRGYTTEDHITFVQWAKALEVITENAARLHAEMLFPAPPCPPGFVVRRRYSCPLDLSRCEECMEGRLWKVEK